MAADAERLGLQEHRAFFGDPAPRELGLPAEVVRVPVHPERHGEERVLQGDGFEVRYPLGASTELLEPASPADLVRVGHEHEVRRLRAEPDERLEGRVPLRALPHEGRLLVAQRLEVRRAQRQIRDVPSDPRQEASEPRLRREVVPPVERLRRPTMREGPLDRHEHVHDGVVLPQSHLQHVPLVEEREDL